MCLAIAAQVLVRTLECFSMMQWSPFLYSPVLLLQEPEGNFARGKEEISAAVEALRQALQVLFKA